MNLRQVSNHALLSTQVVWTAALLVLTPLAAYSVPHCQSLCTQSSDCTQGCWTDDPLVGEYITCGEFGVCVDGQPPVYDMVNWMKQSYSGATTSHLAQVSGPVISEFTGCTFSDTFYRSNDANAEYNELFTFDSTWINIWREVMDASADQFKTHDNFHWLKRQMSPGQCFTADCSWRQHNGSCSIPSETSCSTTVCLEGPVQLNLGGDVGTVDALIRVQLRGNGDKERYFYAEPYGMVMFELRHPNGTLVYSEIFNQIVSGEIVPNPTSCFVPDC